MLSSIRNVKFMKMSKLNMFITAVCVLFLKHGGFYWKHKEIGRLLNFLRSEDDYVEVSRLIESFNTLD